MSYCLRVLFAITCQCKGRLLTTLPIPFGSLEEAELMGIHCFRRPISSSLTSMEVKDVKPCRREWTAHSFKYLVIKFIFSEVKDTLRGRSRARRLGKGIGKSIPLPSHEGTPPPLSDPNKWCFLHHCPQMMGITSHGGNDEPPNPSRIEREPDLVLQRVGSSQPPLHFLNGTISKIVLRYLDELHNLERAH